MQFASAFSVDGGEYYGLLSPFPLAAVFIALVTVIRLVKARRRLVDVPLKGSSGIVASYISAFDFIGNPKAVMKSAREMFGNGTFLLPEVDRYTVVLSNRDLIEDIRKAPDDKVSSTEAAIEVNVSNRQCAPLISIPFDPGSLSFINKTFASKWTIGEDIVRNHFHLSVLRNQLTRSLVALFDDIRDELVQSFNDFIPAEDDGWVAVPVLDPIRNIVCRTSNRIFVGMPLCRDADWIDLNINFTIDVMRTVYKVMTIPHFLRPIICPLMSSTSRNICRGMKLLRPLFEERFRMYEENGDDWAGKPNDLISWLIDEAPDHEKRDIRQLTKRILLINLAAIHTSSNSFVHALLHLAAEPAYIEPLREEVEKVVSEEGWTKVAITRMWKLDSFMRESQRLNGIHTLTMYRKIVSDFTLSDSTPLPAGTFVAANALAVHDDEASYPNPEKFDGFRFSRMRDGSVEESAKHQMVNTSSNYLAFGHGRHACPGRFFAVNELKAMMAHLILTYDVKSEVEGVRPANIYHGARLAPDPKAKVLFKRRCTKVQHNVYDGPQD